MKLARAYWLSASFLLSATHAYAEANEGAPPQMDPTWYPNQLLWLAISFTLMFILVKSVIVPRVSSVLDARETAINDAIREAEHAKAEAESTRSSVASTSNSSRAKAAEIMAAAQAEISKSTAEEIAKLDRELERRASQAEAVLDAAVIKAQLNVEAAADDLAKEMASILLGNVDAEGASAPKLKLAVKR